MNPNHGQAFMNMLDNEDVDDNDDNQDNRDVLINEVIGNMNVNIQAFNADNVDNMLVDDQVEYYDNQDFHNDDETMGSPDVDGTEDNTENAEETGAAIEVSIGIKQDEAEDEPLPGPSRQLSRREEEQNLEDEEFRWWDEFAEISIDSSSDCDSDIPLFYPVSERKETQYQPINSIKGEEPFPDHAENPNNILHIINHDFAQSSSNIDLATDECAAKKNKADVKQVEHSQPRISRKRLREEDEDENRGGKKKRKRKHLQ